MLTNTMDLASKVEELKYKIIHSLTSTDIQYIIQDLKEEHYLVDNLDTKIKDIENFLSKLLSNDTDLQNQIKSLIDCCTKTQLALNDLQNQINNLNTTSSTEPIDTSDPCIRLGLIYNVITNEETLETLSKKFNIDDIKNTFYKNDKYGIGWGTNENKWRYLEVPVPKDAVKIKLTYTGFYNSPSGGIGYLEITKKKNGSSDDRLFSFRDAWTNDYEGQTLVINHNNIFNKKTENIINRTDEINIPQDECIPKLYIGMTGYTSSYPYSKRYIKEFIFLKTTESSGSEIINIEKPSIIKTINDMNFLLCSDTFSAQNCIINFTLSNLIPGKSYRLYFDIGSFNSIDTDSNDKYQHDYIQILVNNNIEKYAFNINAIHCDDRKISDSKGNTFKSTKLGVALPGQDINKYNICGHLNHLFIDFTATDVIEKGYIKLITDEKYSNEAWALLENGWKIETLDIIQ